MSKLLNMLTIEEKDERIINIKHRISSEYSTLIMALFTVYYIINDVILHRNSYVMLIVLGAEIYRDIRLASEGAYNFNGGNTRKSRFFFIMFVYLSFSYIYTFVNSRVMRCSVAILIFSSIIGGLYAYPKMLKKLDNRWKTKNLCE